jgi:hypothetical protein
VTKSYDLLLKAQKPTPYLNRDHLRCDIGTHRLERFSDWMRLVRTIAFLKRVARLRGTKSNDLSTDVESYQEAEECVLKCVQSEAFGMEVDLIRQGKPLKGSSIAITSTSF